MRGMRVIRIQGREKTKGDKKGAAEGDRTWDQMDTDGSRRGLVQIDANEGKESSTQPGTKGKQEAIAEKALMLLESRGFSVWFVGGCVRDLLLGKRASDMDIATSATPSQIKEVFSLWPVVETGIRHGTVTVFMDGVPLEITTYRVDGTYSDGRRPDQVRFTDKIEEDLKRRDFTINAMAYHPNRGICDPFGGQRDLQDGLIRCVLEPQKRFCEDGLRILRGLRFAARFGFQIEEKTGIAMKEQKDLLRSISAERIYSEFTKLIVAEKAGEVLRRYVDVLGVCFPELLAMKGFLQKNPHHKYDVLEHSIQAMENIRKEGAEDAEETLAYLKLAALFHDVGKPITYTEDQKGIGHFYGHAKESVVLTEAVLVRLKVEKELRERILCLIRYHDAKIEPEERFIKRWMRKLGTDGFFDLLALQQADDEARGVRTYERTKRREGIRKRAYLILEEGSCFSLKDLAIDGRDLLDLGISQGPEIGKLLDLALEAVMDGKKENKKDELLSYVLESLTKN